MLDTHTVLWWFANDSISAEALAAIADPENLAYVSVASIWEISIKQAIGKLTVAEELYQAIWEDFEPLHISITDARRAGKLPHITVTPSTECSSPKHWLTT